MHSLDVKAAQIERRCRNHGKKIQQGEIEPRAKDTAVGNMCTAAALLVYMSRRRRRHICAESLTQTPPPPHPSVAHTRSRSLGSRQTAKWGEVPFFTQAPGHFSLASPKVPGTRAEGRKQDGGLQCFCLDGLPGARHPAGMVMAANTNLTSAARTLLTSQQAVLTTATLYSLHQLRSHEPTSVHR